MNRFQEIMTRKYVKVLAERERKNGALNVEDSVESVIENMECLREKAEMFGEETSYLPLPVKKQLAYLLSPTNRMEYSVQRGADWVQCEASFFESEESSFPIGKGFAKAYRTMVFQGQSFSPEQRESKLEAYVRGMAASRAYTDAGIGLQFYGDQDDTDKMEAKEGVTQKAILLKEQEAEQAEDEKAESVLEQQVVPVEVTGLSIPLPLPQTQNERTAKKRQSAKGMLPPMPEATTKAEEKAETVPMNAEPGQDIWTADENTAEMTPETAMEYVADNGSLAKGKTLGDIFHSEDPRMRRTLVWLLKNPPKEGREARMDEAIMTLVRMDEGLMNLLQN